MPCQDCPVLAQISSVALQISVATTYKQSSLTSYRCRSYSLNNNRLNNSRLPLPSIVGTGACVLDNGCSTALDNHRPAGSSGRWWGLVVARWRWAVGWRGILLICHYRLSKKLPCFGLLLASSAIIKVSHSPFFNHMSRSQRLSSKSMTVHVCSGQVRGASSSPTARL